MKTVFLIINYNDEESTRSLINNIKNYKTIDEILIVDNYSSDDCFSKLEKLTNKKIKIIKNSKNNGYGAGINFGAKYLIKKNGKCNIIVSNADIIIPTEEVIIKMIEASKNKNIAIVSPTIIENNEKNNGWKISSAIQEAGYSLPFIHKKLKKRYQKYPLEYYSKEEVEVDVVSGCFFMIKSTSLEEIDFFDENLFLYYEENVIASKLKKISKKTILLSNVEVIHNHSVTIDKSLKRYQKYKQLKKSQEYYVKHYVKQHILANILLIFINRINLVIRYIKR